MTKFKKYKYFIFLLVGMGFISFIIGDNLRIKVVEEEIEVAHFPEDITSFTIVQISDLHEREFGKKQKRLLRKISQIKYDVLVLTGDLLAQPESQNYEPIYHLLEGLKSEAPILFVPGNADAPSYQLYPDFSKSDFIRELEDRGVRFLESYDSIKIGNKGIYFVNFEMAIITDSTQIGKVNGSFHDRYADEPDYQLYQRKLWQEMKDQNILDADELIIALNHYPVVDKRIDYIKKDPATEWVDFDLIISGHYHGGQIRLPFIGALFVPEPWYEPHSFFPPQDRIKGLFEYKGTKQYISAGLGASDAISFLKFRLFNPPEINVLTLTGK